MRIGRYCSFMAALLVAGSLHADTLHLTNGDTLTGVVTTEADGRISLDHPVLGTITIPADQVASVTPAAVAADPADTAVDDADTTDAPQAAAVPAIATTPQAVPADAAITPVDRGLLGTGLFVGWDSSIAAGFTGSSGNSDTLSINAQFKTLYEDDTDRWIWDTTYFLSKDDNERSRNEFKSELTKDWLIPNSKWFYFARGVYEYDEFQAWEHRASGFGGIGYTFVKNDKLELNGRLGAGVTKEFSGDRDLIPEAMVGSTLVRYNITPNQTLTAFATIFPSLSNGGEFRGIAGAEYQIKIDHAEGLSLKLGIQNEYESETADDSKHNDTKYYGALVYDF